MAAEGSAESSRRAEILTILDEAFGHLPVPAPGTLSKPSMIGEEAEIEALFAGRHWRDISTGEIPWEGSFLFRLQPAAFRFYLPAFIRAVIEDYDRLDTLPSDLVGALTYTGASFQEETFSQLSSKEGAAIRRFLEYLAETHADDHFLSAVAGLALDKYWESH